jgi:hypothetical protein
MKTGFSAVFASSSRCRCARVSTSSGFCSTPVAATMWSSGAVMRTSVVAELERELAAPEELLVLPAGGVGVGGDRGNHWAIS